MIGLTKNNYRKEYRMLGKELERLYSLEDIAEMIFHLMQKENISIDSVMKIVDIDAKDQEKVMPMILKLQSLKDGGLDYEE